MSATAAGVLEMTIWLNQRDVYLLMICNDYKAATAYLDKAPKSLEWEEWMAPMIETGEGDEYDPTHAYPDGLPEVFRWEASTAVKRPWSSADKLTLYYLPVRARAENIRMMLAYAGVEFVDKVIPFADWKAEGGLKCQMPFGQLPAIELPGSHGRFVAQSGSCSRAVANICGLCPVDLVEMTYQDSLFEAGQVCLRQRASTRHLGTDSICGSGVARPRRSCRPSIQFATCSVEKFSLLRRPNFLVAFQPSATTSASSFALRLVGTDCS